MVRLFQRNIALQGVLILVLLVLYWLRPLIDPVPMPIGQDDAVLYALFAQWMQGVPRLSVIIAMLLVVAEGVWLNLMLSNAGLTSQNSLLPTLLYIVAMSWYTTTLSPLVWVNGMLLLALQRLMLRGTPFTIDAESVSGVTFAIGMASLFYQPAVLFLLTYLLVAIDYRLYSWRDWMAMLLGFVAPYIAMAAVLYLTGGLLPWWESTMSSFLLEPLALHPAAALPTITSCVMAVLLLWSLLSTTAHVGEHPVLWQHNASSVLLMAVGGAAMMLYIRPLPLPLPLFAIPFSFAAYRAISSHAEPTSAYRRPKRYRWVYDVVLILILISPFVC